MERLGPFACVPLLALLLLDLPSSHETYWHQAETGSDLTHLCIDKTHLTHLAATTGVNVIQLMNWLRGEAPTQTRTSPFTRIMKQAA